MTRFCSLICLGIFGVGIGLTCEAKALPGMDFAFEGKTTRVESPSHTWRLLVKKIPGKNAPNLQEAQVFDRAGRKVLTYEFDRWMEGKWSPSGNLFFLNDYTGPGEGGADCLLPVKEAGRWRLASLIEVFEIAQKRRQDHIPNLKASDFYVTCTRWRDENVLDVSLEGRTYYGFDGKTYDPNKAGAEDFSYRYRYTISTKRLTPMP